ncbi:MAG: DUF1957 domain-containing protein [Cyanobacteria bacterium NC_groundwater_1444_Ag_S-0.65um_54_12]|nr:DUF1957 domain-containing protein [Cyanobacteria bacterium NC_groundwater_1444_Ag_S-0.65um_54_12]
MPSGAVVIVILLHVPYVRRAGVWPYGEHEFYAAMADAFIPLLDELLKLQEAKFPLRITLALSPVLLEQCADPLLRSGFEDYLLRRLQQAEQDMRALPRQFTDVLHWQRWRAEGILDSWSNRHKRSLVRTIRDLERAGTVEAIAYPATGAILPLLPRTAAARGQIVQGLRVFERYLEHATTGMWLPGGAIVSGDQHRDNSSLLLEHGVLYTLTSERAAPGIAPNLPWQLPSGLKLLASQEDFLATCLSQDTGFPSSLAYSGPPDSSFRRLYRRGASQTQLSRLASWPPGIAITVAAADQGEVSRLYDPVRAVAVAQEQGLQAAALAAAMLSATSEHEPQSGMIMLPLDAAIFCSWLEGPRWFGEFVRAIQLRQLSLLSGAQAINQYRSSGISELLPASWEPQGDLSSWLAPNTSWYWDTVATVLDMLESGIVNFGANANPLLTRILAQATREALLLLSGEWPCLLGKGGEAKDYAAERVRTHYERFRRLFYLLGAEELDTSLLEHYEALDNLFSDLDYYLFV